MNAIHAGRPKIVVYRKYDIISNYRGTIRKNFLDPEVFLAHEVDRLWPGSSFVTIVHNGEMTVDKSRNASDRLLRSDNEVQILHEVTDQLIASLFYLEVVSVPTRFPQSCKMRMRCRLPPSNHLFNLLFRLRQRDAKVHCRSTSRQWHCKKICSMRQWQALKKGGEFEICWIMEFTSPQSPVEVKIDGFLEEGHVSKNTDTLAKLLEQQAAAEQMRSARICTQQLCHSASGMKDVETAEPAEVKGAVSLGGGGETSSPRQRPVTQTLLRADNDIDVTAATMPLSDAVSWTSLDREMNQLEAALESLLKP